MRRRKIPRFTRRRPDRRRGCRRGRAERMNEQNGGVGKTPADNPFAALDAGRPAWDALGAFVPAPQPRIAGKASGPLAGLTFAAKDIFDVAGFVTGCGNPARAGSQAPATPPAPIGRA